MEWPGRHCRDGSEANCSGRRAEEAISPPCPCSHPFARALVQGWAIDLRGKPSAYRPTKYCFPDIDYKPHHSSLQSPWGSSSPNPKAAMLSALCRAQKVSPSCCWPPVLPVSYLFHFGTCVLGTWGPYLVCRQAQCLQPHLSQGLNHLLLAPLLFELQLQSRCQEAFELFLFALCHELPLKILMLSRVLTVA